MEARMIVLSFLVGIVAAGSGPLSKDDARTLGWGAACATDDDYDNLCSRDLADFIQAAAKEVRFWGYLGAIGAEAWDQTGESPFCEEDWPEFNHGEYQSYIGAPWRTLVALEKSLGGVASHLDQGPFGTVFRAIKGHSEKDD